jgi:hypothetical protein
MIYANSNNVKSDSLKQTIIRKLPEKFSKLLDLTDEFCFYANKTTLFNCYTLRFKNVKNVSFQSTDSLLNLFNLSITGMEPSFIKLDGGKNRKGCIHIAGNQYTMKIYTQTAPVNEEIRDVYLSLSSLLSRDDYDFNTKIYSKLDSLERLDSVYSAVFFDNLMEKEKQNGLLYGSKRTVNVRSVFKKDIYQSAVIAYLNTKEIAGIPYHLFNAFNQDFYGLYEWILYASEALNYYEDLWLNMVADEQGIKITNVLTTNKKQKLLTMVDKDIICHLPGEKPAVLNLYNFNLSVLKYNLIKSFNLLKIKDKEKTLAKMILLILDDDLLNSIGNGFLSILDGDFKDHKMPDFKLVIKMPDNDKGRLLLDLLCNDFKILKKVTSNYYTLSDKYKDEENNVNLYIDENIWVLGTDPIETLKLKLTKSQYLELYPQLGEKKLSQLIYADKDFLSSIKKDFEEFNIRTSLKGRKRVETIIQIKKGKENLD